MKVLSRGENNVPNNKDHLLYYFWLVVLRDAHRISIVNVVILFIVTVLLATQFVLMLEFQLKGITIASSPTTILEIEVVSLSSIIAFFVALQKIYSACAQIFAILKFH